jgi:hypothetical protein
MAVLEQAVQESFSLPCSAKSLQGIRWDGDDPNDFSVIQPNQTVSLFDVMPLANHGRNVGLTFLGHRSLHREHLQTKS